MKAAYYTETGSPEVIRYGDLPRPVPKAGEVLVRVEAVSVNPIDTYIRSGTVAMALPKPFIPGCDLAGTVAECGPGVRVLRPGMRVWGSNQGMLGRQGTSAEFACIAEEWLYSLPEGMNATDAAALALVGITAHLGLFRCAQLKAGETVFVNGGTGGVGSMVVQMAKAVGARVITTVGSQEKAEICQRWGADYVLDYKTANIAEEVRAVTGGQGVQVWYETQREPDFLKTVDLLARRGRMVIMAGRQAQPVFPVGPFYVKDCSLFGFAIFNASAEEQRRCAEDINRWTVGLNLRPIIGKLFPLVELAAAHRLQEESTLQKAGNLTGKIVVTP